MSNWKDGFTAGNSSNITYYLDYREWVDYNTFQEWYYTYGSRKAAYVFTEVDDISTGFLVRDIYYYDTNVKPTLVLGDIDLFVKYSDYYSSGTFWYLFALSGDDVLSGNMYRDILKGAGGSDSLLGNGGNDALYGEKGNDFLNGGSGKDKLFGGAGRDKLVGQGGNDVLKGGGGNDILKGGNRADVLNGGNGNDVLIGGGGNDRFVFQRGCGNDTVRDFQSGFDHIDIGAGASRFRDLDIYRSGSDTIVDFANVSITFEDTRPGQLDASDFWF
jgi:Ca2+-binding RTX toxin-like protein